MLKSWRECPIYARSGSVAALIALAFTLAPAAAGAFPATTGAKANDVLGQPNFETGFVDFDADQFFGAEFPSERRLFVPHDVAFDTAADRLFVADLHNARVLVFDLSDGVPEDDALAATFVLGQPDFTTGGADPDNPFGNKNTQNPLFGCETDVNACGLGRAWALDYDEGSERLFVADPDNHRVLIWDLSSGIQNGMPATHVLGQPDFQSNEANTSCDGEVGVVDGCGLNFPYEVHFDARDERLFVSDIDNNRVLIFDLFFDVTDGMPAEGVLGQAELTTSEPGAACGGGASAGATSACGLSEPAGLAFDEATGRLFVADSDTHRVVQYDITFLFPRGIAATHVLGQQDFTSTGANADCEGATTGSTNTNECGLGIFEMSLAYDGDRDRLYASDPANHRVLVFDVESLSDGQPAIAALGQPDFSSGYDPAVASLGGATARNRLMIASGLAYDPVKQRLFVTDGGNHRVVAFGANVGGVPIEVENGEVSDVEEHDDGSVTVTLIDEDGTAITVTFPPGTEPAEGEDNIKLVATQSDHPTHQNSQIEIHASMPAGTTKSVTFELDEGDENQVVCVRDRSDPYFTGGNCTEDEADKIDTLPAPGTCETVSVQGDPGDNPDDPDDPEGWHDIDICVSSDGGVAEMHGLLHTGVRLERRLWEAPELPDPRVPYDPPGYGDGADGDPKRAAAAGCAAAGGDSGLGAGAIALALVALAWRRRGYSLSTRRAETGVSS